MSQARDQRRAEERWQRRDRIIRALTAVLPDLAPAALAAALEAARADRGIGLRELDEHLASRPDALTVGDPRCPAVVVRLARALREAGHDGVVVPGCSECGRTGVVLPRLGPAGRVCQACNARSAANKRPCARCGRLGRIVARRDEGGICPSCYRVDPQVVQPCSGCGQTRMPVTRRPDGKPLCERCWTPPAHRCSSCGRTGQARALGPTGALCAACYQRDGQPRRPCGECGKIMPIVRRAVGGSPDLCRNCAAPPLASCSVCAQLGPCRTNNDGQPVCRACRPRPTRPCSVCGRTRPIQAHWPRGPVCGACYVRVLDHPAQCSHCRSRQPLIAYDDAGGEICGPCSGLPGVYICPGCGRGGRLYADGRCPRCVLAERLGQHLAGPDGQVHAQLRPVLNALAAADDARGSSVGSSAARTRSSSASSPPRGGRSATTCSTSCHPAATSTTSARPSSTPVSCPSATRNSTASPPGSTSCSPTGLPSAPASSARSSTGSCSDAPATAPPAAGERPSAAPTCAPRSASPSNC